MNINNLKNAVPDSIIAEIPQVMSKFSINTTLRLSHFLAQCAEESENFKVLSENLDYSVQALLSVFHKYFNSGNVNEYARNPVKIANLVYANRMGNGPEASGDGYKFRGRGYIEITGKDNYKAFGETIGVDLVSNPDLVATKYPLLSAAWFFSSHGLNVIADRGANNQIVTIITEHVNGGNNGLSVREANFSKFYKLLS